MTDYFRRYSIHPVLSWKPAAAPPPSIIHAIVGSNECMVHKVDGSKGPDWPYLN